MGSEQNVQLLSRSLILILNATRANRDAAIFAVWIFFAKYSPSKVIPELSSSWFEQFRST